ncbi:MAG TPA: hypothetical protein VHJ17_18275 [Thermomonospora sp.]|nr:hypothetical protein [Thermomonospora sp.]
MADDQGGADVLAASRVIKEAAAGQKLTLDLAESALADLLDRWDPERPAEIELKVDGRPVGNLRIAVCSYSGDTCCA